MASPQSSPPNPEELHRAISVLSLSGLHERSGNAPAPATNHEHGYHYSPTELLNIRDYGAKEAPRAEADIVDEGEEILSPKGPPTVPPPTPEHLPEIKKVQFHSDPEPPKDATEEEPKKKKKRKSSGKNKQAAPTGFEEYYADAPVTPDEWETEQEKYDTSISFPQRIQYCIQRYRAKRKLDEVRGNILTKYFALGGIETGAKSFNGGLDEETLQNATAEEIQAIQATDFVRPSNRKFYNPNEPDNWVVDFEGVVKGFLSYRCPTQLGIENEKDIKLYAAIVRNFLNYVILHQVCLDYTADVLAARKICDLAEREWASILQLRNALPGSYNVAASTLYGGHYQNMYSGSATWDVEENWVNNRAVSDQEAERIFKTAIAFAGTDALFLEAMKADVHIAKTESRCFEVVKVERPSLDTIKEYAAVKDHKGESGYIKPLGVIYFKHWEGPGIEPEDVTDNESEAEITADAEPANEMFWLEDEILQHCFPGLKVQLLVHELNIGVKFFDRIEGLYPSFFLYLPNEKMAHWKEPVPNERPAPTEDDPDAEEKAMNAIMEREAEEIDKEMEGNEAITTKDATSVEV